MKTNKLYAIGIGGIGVSGLARYYLWENWEVFWSDSADSALISTLKNEWCDIIIWADKARIESDINLLIYTEAIPESHPELEKAKKLWIKTLKYNEALAEVVNTHKLIAVTGTHWKSTTTSMISQILKRSDESFKSIVGTLLREFDGKNYYSSTSTLKSETSILNSFSSKEKEAAVSPLSLEERVRERSVYFVIEACEHKEHFLAYKPTVWVITNIEYDHADYFKTPADYLKAFEKFIENIVPGGFCVINGDDTNCQKLIWKRKDIHYIIVREENFSTLFPNESQESNIETYPEIVMQVPGQHILFDAKLSYIVSHMIGIAEITALESLEDYSGVWRRMEKIWETENGNILMSDYGHHPTEIAVTLEALKKWYPDRQLLVIFQPHQYSRTIELLDGFKACFSDANKLIIPDIYESRDTDENKAQMNTDILVKHIGHDNVRNGQWMDNTLGLIEKYDRENLKSSILLLLWAGNIDNLRYKIKTR